MNAGRPYTKAEDQAIRNAYADYQGPETMRSLSEAIGRGVRAIQLRASRLGLGNPSRGKPHLRKIAGGNGAEFANVHDKYPDRVLAAMFGVKGRGTVCRWRKALGLKKSPSDMWRINEHPRGMTGKRQTEHAKRRVSESSTERWADPCFRMNSSEYRQLLSDRMANAQASGALRSRYSRGSQGRRDDLGGLYVRSSWEANFARYLNWLISMGQIKKWEYEPDTFWFDSIKRGVRSYTPDFKVWESLDAVPYYIEVKGWMDAKSKTKLKRMAKYFPQVRVEVVAQRQYQQIAASVGRLISGWEARSNRSVIEDRT